LRAIGVLPMTADQLRVRRARFEGALLRFLRDHSNQESRRDMRDALFDSRSCRSGGWHAPSGGSCAACWTRSKPTHSLWTST